MDKWHTLNELPSISHYSLRCGNKNIKWKDHVEILDVWIFEWLWIVKSILLQFLQSWDQILVMIDQTPHKRQSVTQKLPICNVAITCDDKEWPSNLLNLEDSMQKGNQCHCLSKTFLICKDEVPILPVCLKHLLQWVLLVRQELEILTLELDSFDAVQVFYALIVAPIWVFDHFLSMFILDFLLDEEVHDLLALIECFIPIICIDRLKTLHVGCIEYLVLQLLIVKLFSFLTLSVAIFTLLHRYSYQVMSQYIHLTLVHLYDGLLNFEILEESFNLLKVCILQ